MIAIIHRTRSIEQLQKTMRGQRCVHKYDYVYSGWTGFEEFGVIRSYRYYGWRVTCWADVMYEAYGTAHRARFFDRIDEAAAELEQLMNIAKRMRKLSKVQVEYFDAEAAFGPIRLESRCDLEWITPDMKTDSRAPHGSPAAWRRFAQRHNEPYPPDWIVQELENVSP